MQLQFSESISQTFAASEFVEYFTPQTISEIVYLVASILFILGIKGLTHPRSAVRGNLLGALAMLLASVVTFWMLSRQSAAWSYFLDSDIQVIYLIAIAIGLGTIIGAFLAVKIKMTAMPQLVAIFNGFGGLASVLVAGAALSGFQSAEAPSIQFMIATAASGIIGTITFWGSLVAFGKLQELRIFKKNLKLPGQQIINLILVAAVIGLSVWMIMQSRDQPISTYGAQTFVIICVIASVLGFFLVTPIGGADMPVVIALLNSYSGLAAAATGFVVDNNLLIIAGSLVGASGVILTSIMCKAMNRSLTNVLFGTMEASGESASADEVYAGKVTSTSADEVAMLCDGVQNVVIVPGYGMAVAQAQHAVRDVYRLLEEQGANVEFAIHPVAGRMPGHMNVLLAEAEVPYDKLIEMDVINPRFSQTDLVIVIGANDVVNPVARTDPDSPIAGMPILDVDQARTVVVVKRSLSPGFAGIPNPLFAADNCLMLFGDGKQAMVDMVAALKEN